MLFLAGEKVRVSDEPACEEGNWMTVAALPEEGALGAVRFTVRACLEGACREGSCRVDTQNPPHAKNSEYSLGRLVYTIWSELTGLRPAWGILTGFGCKLFRQQHEAGMSEEEIRSWLAREGAPLPR